MMVGSGLGSALDADVEVPGGKFERELVDVLEKVGGVLIAGCGHRRGHASLRITHAHRACFDIRSRPKQHMHTMPGMSLDKLSKSMCHFGR